MRRKVLAFSLGTVFLLVLLELSLPVLNRAFMHLQTRGNLRSQGGSGSPLPEVRILALGESTTTIAGDETNRFLVPWTAYPGQLEEVLNSRQSRVKYKVFNAGIMAGTTGAIIDHLDFNISQYKPDIIIAMMGIKDLARGTRILEEQSGWERLRTSFLKWARSLHLYALYGWVREILVERATQVSDDIESQPHLSEFVEEKRLLLRRWSVRESRLLGMPEQDQEKIERSLQQGVYLLQVGRFARAEQVLRNTVAETGVGRNALGRVLWFAGKREDARKVLLEAIRLNPEEPTHATTMAEFLMEERDLDGAEKVLQHALANPAQVIGGPILRDYARISLANVYRQKRQYQKALDVLARVNEHAPMGLLRGRYPAIEMLWNSAMGEIYFDMKDYVSAEKHLRVAALNYPGFHSHVLLLGLVYKKLGKPEKEIETRVATLRDTGRMGEYLEVAALFKRSGQGDRIPELIRQATEQIPDLPKNFERLYDTAKARGIRLVLMQYPFFSLDVLKMYSPAKDDIVYVDNEHLFDKAPEEYLYEPQYSFSFNHYSRKGARFLAEHVANHILPLRTLGEAR